MQNQQDDSPKKGEIWTHNKTGIPYFVRDTVNTKIDNEWVGDGVVIYENGIGKRYARLLPDFLAHFNRQ
jgi:hypothetical protein